jgi:hypothetical protein
MSADPTKDANDLHNIPSGGKYFHVNVPDFTKEGAKPPNTGGDKRDAYLRVGDVGALADTVTAKHLVDQFTGFAADAGITSHERDASDEGVIARSSTTQTGRSRSSRPRRPRSSVPSFDARRSSRARAGATTATATASRRRPATRSRSSAATTS